MYRQFTVIDFLSMLIPGAVVVLVANWVGVPFVALWTAFVPDGSIGLTLYLVVLSYLVGHVLSQVTKPLEKLSGFQNSEREMRTEYEDVVMKKAEELGLTEYIPKDQREEKLLWRRVQYCVLQRADCQRLRLMQGFYGLCRSSVASVMVVWLCLCVHAGIAPEMWCVYTVIGVVGVIMLTMRGKKFRKKYLETMYETFLLLESVSGKITTS